MLRLVAAVAALLLGVVGAQTYPLHATNSSYEKIPGILQFGDVSNWMCENSKFLTAATGSCVSVQVGSGDTEDFGLVNPVKGEDNHDPITSGDLVSIRASGTGKFLAVETWDDEFVLSWQDEATQETQFKIVIQSEVSNAEESTSLGTYSPSGNNIPYGTKVVLFPVGPPSRTGSKSKNFGKFSLYAQESGLMYYTDSTFMSWLPQLADHNTCYGDGDVSEGAMCCNWKVTPTPNEGVATSEQRLCCRRSGKPICHATEKRIKECAAGYSADEARSSVASSLELAQTTAAEATELEAAAAAAQVGLSTALENRQTAEQQQAAIEASGGDSSATQITVAAMQSEYEAAQKAAESAAEAATLKRSDADSQMQGYQASASGGSCCSWKDPGGDGNPKVFDLECCTADGCSVREQVTSHKECNWHGLLTAEGCQCHSEYGGADCLVEVSHTCFSGVRSNGDTSSLAPCATCYKCQSGLPTVVNGVVTIAGDDRCSTLQGPESLCLTCGTGAGLLKLGDGDQVLWDLGYRSLGQCTPFPSSSLDITTMKAQCESNCFPRHVTAYQTGRSQECASLCSVWNPVKVSLSGSNVDTTGLCHVAKEVHCIADSTLNDLSSPRRCFNKKKVHPKLVCHRMAQKPGNAADATPVTYSNGFGTGCGDGAAPAADFGVSGSDVEQWCCWDAQSETFSLPDWLSQVSEKQWCASAALVE